MEIKLGEVDRARAVLRYASQMANPNSATEFWSYWKHFEEFYGNEDAYRELLKVERAVKSSFVQVIYLTTYSFKHYIIIFLSRFHMLNNNNNNNNLNSSLFSLLELIFYFLYLCMFC